MDYRTLDDLYELMPILYRLRDVDQGLPLKAFLRVVEEQVEIVQQNIDRLWDDFSIETCDPWVIPYIADLVANQPLHDFDGRISRADVARTIYYRRRKGTLPMLEELARDVTDWGCHAVEFFELLGWTQNLNHLRMYNFRTPDLRDVDLMDRLNGPFDQIAHTADIRPPSTVEGWHNICNIGFFLYRLGSYPLRGTLARQAQAPNQHGYHFSTLGAPSPLFNRERPEGDEAGLATEPFVPGPIRPTTFHFDLERYRERLTAGSTAISDYYGTGLSLAVEVNGAFVPPEIILCKNLSNWDRPPAGMVAVDTELGRMTFAVGEEPPPGTVKVEYHYGFSGDMGGGPYDRRRKVRDRDGFPDTITDPTAGGNLTVISVKATEDVSTLTAALNLWVAANKPPAVIQIEDDHTYEENLTIPMQDAQWLTIQADNEHRPTLVGRVWVTGLEPDARLAIDGLLIEGYVRLRGNLKEFRMRHTTLVPGRVLKEDGTPQFPDRLSLIAGLSNVSLSVVIEHSITGPIRLPVEMVRLDVRDSILDGLGRAAIARLGTTNGSGPPTELRRVTVLGPVYLRKLEYASEVIFTRPVIVERAQEGCVRFSYVFLHQSKTPQRFRCQPDLALAEEAKALGRALHPVETDRIFAQLRPSFTSFHYGDPGYGQLSLNCPQDVQTGAEDESEMGAFSSLRQPQRVTNLLIRLEEYLPFGLKPALFYVT